MVAFAPAVPGVGTLRWGSPAGRGVWNDSGSCTIRGPFFAPGSCRCALCRLPGAWKALTPAGRQETTVMVSSLKHRLKL